MTIQVFVGDRHGWKIAEMTPKLGPISWQLNKAGKATLTLSKNDPKMTEDNLQIGNRVLLKFDNGLPLWGGTIELPRTWTATDVSVTGYSIEFMLGYRITKKNRAFYNAPVGAIFQAVIREAQLYESLGIELGRIWSGGGNHSPRYHFKKVMDVLTESLCKMEGCDFAFLPRLSSNRIFFVGELYQQRGVDKSGQVILLEGANVGPTTMEEQGPLVNHFASIGSGSTWGDERQVVMKEDPDSIKEIGLREDSDVYSGVVYSTTLERHATTAVRDSSRPYKRFAVDVANKAPALYSSYDIGDIVRLILTSYGFNGYDHAVRILAREYDPATERCTLVVEEPHEVEPVYAGEEEEI